MRILSTYILSLFIGVGVAVAQDVPDITVTPDTYNFESVFVGSVRDQAFLVRNDGTANLVVFATSIQGTNEDQFQIIGGGGGRILAPGAAALINVRFRPTSPGVKTGLLRIDSDDTDEAFLNLPIQGTGLGLPDILVNTGTLSFGDVRVGTTVQRELIVSNVGNANLNVTSVAFSGPDVGQFKLAVNNLPFTLAPAGRDTIRVDFTPASGGNKSAQIAVSNSDPDENPVNILLTGRGVRPEIEIDATNYDFGELAVNASVSHTFTITNLGTASLLISNSEIVGTDAESFAITGGGGRVTVGAGGFRDITVRFTPVAPGTKSATLRIHNDDEDENPLDIPLTGSGFGQSDIALSQTTLAFGNVRVQTTALQEIVVLNLGLVDLKITSGQFQGPDPSLFQLVPGRIPMTIAPGARDTIRVQFTPLSGGDKSATLALQNNDPDENPVNVLLTGRGVRPEIEVDALSHDFGELAVGASASFSFTVTNLGTSSLLITDSEILGADPESFAITGGGGRVTVGAGGFREITVRFTATTPGTQSATLRIHNDDEDENPFDIALSGAGFGQPDIALSRTVVAFGNVRVQSTAEQEIIVVNLGLVDLEITSGQFQGADPTLFQLEPGKIPMTIAPEARDTIRVQFTPLSGGNKSATLVLQNNDPDENPSQILVAGAGVRPEPSIDANGFDFGLVAVGTQSVTEFILTNSGTGSLFVSETDIYGPDSVDFDITAGGGTFTLVPGASRTLEVEFSPSTEGPRSASLVISSDDLLLPTLSASLAGTGTAIAIQAPGTVPANQDVSLSVTVPPGFQPVNGKLFYRLAGELIFRPAAVSVIGAAFQAVIPASAATLSGIEYYAVATNDDATITFPRENPQTEPIFLPVRVSELSTPLTFVTWEYRMISVPLELDDPSVASVLLDDYGDYNTRRWRLFRWENGVNVEYADFSAAFEPGLGFWLVTNDGQPFTVQNGESVDPATSRSIILQPGWNQIGNPYSFAIDWPDTFIDPSIGAPVWFDGSEYVYQRGTLEPWEGYFVLNSGAVPVTVPLSLRGLFGSGKGRDAATASQASDFTLQIAARIAGTPYVDSQNFIGVKNTALDGRDASDFIEAPPIGEYIRWSFVEEGQRFAGNFKSASAEGHFWDVEFDATLPEAYDVDFSLTRSGDFPAETSIFVLDMDNRNAVPVAGDAFRLTTTPDGTIRHFRVLVGPQSFAKAHAEDIPLEPVAYELEQNYPNPFNPETTIRYQLNRPSTVQLVVYDVMGRLVRTLVDAPRDTGVHEVRWDGRNDAGLSLASGLYIYRLRSGEFEASRKMLLIR